MICYKESGSRVLLFNISIIKASRNLEMQVENFVLDNQLIIKNTNQLVAILIN